MFLEGGANSLMEAGNDRLHFGKGQREVISG